MKKAKVSNKKQEKRKKLKKPCKKTLQNPCECGIMLWRCTVCIMQRYLAYGEDCEVDSPLWPLQKNEI